MTFILLRWVKYYTKELAKALEITIFGAIIILLVIGIKYKPVYEVDLFGEKLGYVKNKEIIEENFKNYVEDISGSVAFKEQSATPEYEYKLINRREQTNSDDEILVALENTVKVTYRTYAVTVNGEKQAIVSTEEEAQEVVENVKSDVDAETIGLNLGIVEEYSEELNVQSKEETFDVLNNIKIAKVDEYNAEQEAIRKAEEEAKRKEREEATKRANVASSGIVSTIAGLNLSRPVNGTITSRFGSRSSIRSSAHTGLDIGASLGTSIVPICEGKVTFAGRKGSYGNLVIINHGNGLESYYAHCNTIYVTSGQSVDRGTVIASVGSTGNSTGPHLHVEMRLNGNILNPENYLY